MSTLLAPILQYFFTEHLTSHKQVSPRTIVAYRDSFRLLLQFEEENRQTAIHVVCRRSGCVRDSGLPGASRRATRQPNLLSECPAYRDSILFPCCGSARSGQRRCCQSRPCHSEETNRQAAGGISDPRGDRRCTGCAKSVDVDRAARLCAAADHV
jgi:hypothetical protein